MSPLAGFLIFIASITALIIAYLTKEFDEENITYSKNSQIKNKNLNIKTIEKEKVVAKTLNGRFAMIDLMAVVGAYLTTGQIIPGFV